MSTNVAAGKLMPLGKLHFGRKQTQPPRSMLKDFYRRAEHQLEHPILWFDSAKRQVISDAFAEVVKSQRYTCFACAILANHAHLIIRKHRDHAEDMIFTLRKDSAKWLRRLADVPNNHPVWSSDQFKKYLNTPHDIDRTIRYVEDNPAKSNLSPQQFNYVKRFQ
ncbi:MAG: hypothetical protein O7D91_12665 [Planctomycetota bacterium]|nr:hypothetical protein [Planctomycetota bacterium]